MTRGKKVSRAFLVACLALIVLQIGLYTVFGIEKQGYFIDEIFSYGLSNSYDRPFLSSDFRYNQWTDQSYFLNYLEVQPEHRFAYDAVYANQENDVHPPLFYFLLHTVCSFFPGTFSKWFGLSLNAVLMVGTNLLLLAVGTKVLRDRWLALIACAAFVLNPVTISCFLFIRMYALFLFLAAAYFSLHVGQAQKPRGILTPILIAVTVFLGCMTHYYFLVLACVVAAFYVPMLLIKKYWRAAVFYVLALCAGIAAGYFFFPQSGYHIFGGYRGIQAFGQWDAFWRQGTDGLFAGLFGKLVLLAGALMILAFAIWFFRRRKAKKQRNADSRTSPVRALMIAYAISTILYIGIIFVVAPYDDTRYYFCLFGFGIILLAYFAVAIIRRFLQNKKVIRAAAAILFAALSVFTFICEPVDYLYPEKQGYNEAIAPYRGSSCIYVINRSSGTWHIHEEAVRLARFDAVFFIGTNTLVKRVQTLAEKQELSAQCVMFIDRMDYSGVHFDTLLEVTDYTQYHELYGTEYNIVVLLE